MNVGGESPQYRRLRKGLSSNIVFPHTCTQICGHDANLVVLKLSLTMKRNLNFVAIRVRVSQ